MPGTLAGGRVADRVTAAACFALVLFGTIGLRATQNWQSAGVRDGVTLTYRDDPQLNAREVRAVAELPHAAQRIVAIACDFTQLLDPDVREARMLSGDIDTRYEIYLRYAPRFMVVSARDVVLDVKRDASGCSWSEAADRVAPQEGAVRMPLLRGSWVVEPIASPAGTPAGSDGARSRVTYQIAVRPGGRIPGWMVRRGAVSALPDAIARIARCVSSPPARDGRCAKPAS